MTIPIKLRLRLPICRAVNPIQILPLRPRSPIPRFINIVPARLPYSKLRDTIRIQLRFTSSVLDSAECVRPGDLVISHDCNVSYSRLAPLITSYSPERGYRMTYGRRLNKSLRRLSPISRYFCRYLLSCRSIRILRRSWPAGSCLHRRFLGRRRALCLIFVVRR